MLIGMLVTVMLFMHNVPKGACCPVNAEMSLFVDAYAKIYD